MGFRTQVLGEFPKCPYCGKPIEVHFEQEPPKVELIAEKKSVFLGKTLRHRRMLKVLSKKKLLRKLPSFRQSIMLLTKGGKAVNSDTLEKSAQRLGIHNVKDMSLLVTALKMDGEIWELPRGLFYYIGANDTDYDYHQSRKK